MDKISTPLTQSWTLTQLAQATSCILWSQRIQSNKKYKLVFSSHSPFTKVDTLVELLNIR